METTPLVTTVSQQRDVDAVVYRRVAAGDDEAAAGQEGQQCHHPHTQTHRPSCLSAKTSAVQTLPPPPKTPGGGASEGEDAGWLRKTRANYGTLGAICVQLHTDSLIKLKKNNIEV